MQTSIAHRYTITVDDDPIQTKLIERHTGIPSELMTDRTAIFARIRERHPVAVFVDIDLGPDQMSGLQLVPELRQRLPFCPILVITSDGRAACVKEALESGADDFIRKPLEADELISRLQMRLKDHADRQKRSVVQFADIFLDVIHHCLKGNGKTSELSPVAVRVLQSLMEAEGTTVERNALLHHAWGKVNVTTNAVERRIFEIRTALSEVSKILEVRTVYGKGYCLAKK